MMALRSDQSKKNRSAQGSPGEARAARSRRSATPLSPGCRSAPRLDRQRRICRRQPAADRTRSRRTVEGLAADGARSADRARSRGQGAHPRRLRHLCQRARIARAAGVGVGEIEGPFELLRAREFIEGAIAEQAARVATPEDIARIDAARRGDGDRCSIPAKPRWSTTAPFMSRSRDASAMPCWCASSANCSISGSIPISRSSRIISRIPETWQAALAEHQAIRAAIAAHDPDAAGAAMRKHLARRRSASRKISAPKLLLVSARRAAE